MADSDILIERILNNVIKTKLFPQKPRELYELPGLEVEKREL